MTQQSSKAGRRFAAGDVAVALTLLVALLIALNASEWLRGGFGWRWNYEAVPLFRLLPLILTSAVYVAGALWLLNRTQRAVPVLVWAVVGGVAVALAGVAARQPDVAYELFTRTASLSTGQQWAAVQVDWANGEWRSWAQVMARLGGRVTNIPPGAPLVYTLLIDALDRLPALAAPLHNWLIAYQCNNYDLLAYTPGQWASSLLGMLMPLWAALTALPIYGLAKRFIGADARYAALWWALVPGIIVFAASWSTIYPLIAVLCFWLLVKGLESQRGALLLVLSGAVYGVGVFVNFALIPLPLLLGLYTLGDLLLVQKRRLSAAVSAGQWFGVGIIIPWLVYWAFSGETFFDLLGASMQFHLNLDRPYLFWVGMHLWDWLLWTGVGFGVLGIAFLWRARRQRAISRFAVLAASLALAMLILILSGTARGETGRVWLFFSPFLLIVGAGALRQLAPAPRFGALTVTQALYMIALVASLNAMTTDLLPPPSAPQVSVARAADATFSDGDRNLFRLTGWDAAAAGDGIDLRLNWQGLNQTTIPYWFGAVLVAPDGETVGIDPWQPGGALRYPTTCWATQANVGDTVHLALPTDAASGDWWISLEAYPGSTAAGQLTVTQPGVTQTGQPLDQQIGLGPIAITN